MEHEHQLERARGVPSRTTSYWSWRGFDRDANDFYHEFVGHRRHRWYRPPNHLIMNGKGVREALRRLP